MPDWKTIVGWQSHSGLTKSALSLMESAGSVITNLNDGGVFRTLVEVCTYGISTLWDGLVERWAPGSFLQTATGVWLEYFADDYGDAKLLAERTVGSVRFGRSGTTGNVSIPVNTIVTTQISPAGAKLRYMVTATTVLPDGQLSVLVPVRAEFTGSIYNVAAGYIALLETPVAGVETVENEDDWIATEGRDDELDAALRVRLRLKWPQLSRGATADAYRGWALDAGATSAQVDDQHPRGPGTVDVIVTGPNGTPSAELLVAVQAYIDARRPQCADVDVVGPELVPVNLAGTLYLDPDASDDELSAAELSVQERVLAWYYGSTALDVPPRAPGDDAALGQLRRLLMDVERAYDDAITSPAATVSVTSRQLVSQGTVALTVARRAER